MLGRRWTRPCDEDQRRGTTAHARPHFFPALRNPPLCVVAKWVLPTCPWRREGVCLSVVRRGPALLLRLQQPQHLLSTYCVRGSALHLPRLCSRRTC